MKQNRADRLLDPPSTDFCVLEYECAYLPDKKVRMNYKFIEQASKEFTTAVVDRGWRRFGKYFFHPICNGCNECKSLRIRVEEFAPSKSQRKVIRKNSKTQIIIQKPTLSSEHISLYNKYHQWKAIKDGWRGNKVSQKEYFDNFVDGSHDFGREVAYYDDGRLIGVDLIDIVDDGISSIYFYHDPDYAHLSLGTYSLLYQIELAAQMKLPYIYLGYWVDGCKAFTYKTNFTPLDKLDGFPSIKTDPKWL